VADFVVGTKGALSAEQFATLRAAGIESSKVGPTIYAGFNKLRPVLTYVHVDATDESEAKVAGVLHLDAREMVARPAPTPTGGSRSSAADTLAASHEKSFSD
jgi:hypothetical protein